MQEFLAQSLFLDLLTVAEGVQTAVDNGKWSYLAVITLFLVLEYYKRHKPEKKKDLAKISAGLGTATGAIGGSLMGSDPITGAIGGFMVGNAASGLSSFLKGLSASPVGDLLSIMKVAISLVRGVSRRIDKANRKEALKKFDEAIKATEGEKASTKELEKWVSEYL